MAENKKIDVTAQLKKSNSAHLEEKMKKNTNSFQGLHQLKKNTNSFQGLGELGAGLELELSAQNQSSGSTRETERGVRVQGGVQVVANRRNLAAMKQEEEDEGYFIGGGLDGDVSSIASEEEDEYDLDSSHRGSRKGGR
jgi:hypothetical protein